MVPSTRSLPSLNLTAADRKRWLLLGTGMEIEEIAARQKVTVHRVRDSIAKMAMYLKANSHEIVDARVNELALAKLEKFSGFMDEAMTALKTLSDGKTQVRDLEPGFKAMKLLKDLIESIRPKGAGVAVQVNTQVNGGGGGVGANSQSFEERLRKIRERNNLRNDDVAETINATVVDEDSARDESEDDAEDEDEGDEQDEEIEEGELVEDEDANENAEVPAKSV